MDQPSVTAYDKSAADFAADWRAQPAPDDLHALMRRFFRPGLTADIGCGSGREVAWLNANGFSATGYDPSEGLLAQARALYPELTFVSAALPDLAGVPEAGFDNVLCETVLMHLTRDAIAPSVRRLVAILRPGGCLCLSWRVTVGVDQRDAHGRLYAAFEPDLVTDALARRAAILLNAQATSASSGKTIHRVIARKEPIGETANR
jgi:SAM-dependent methyltransferase